MKDGDIMLVKMGEGRIMFDKDGKMIPTDTEYEITHKIIECYQCKYWMGLGDKIDGFCARYNYYNLPDHFVDGVYMPMGKHDFCSKGEWLTYEY